MAAPSAPSSTATSEPAPRSSPESGARDAADKEAFEYWGYLFKPDKTGTDRLQSLLRGLKHSINTHFADPAPKTDVQPDLTPEQLAYFYRELHGNYDQLFLGTPHESLAFIYKSLGCLHSLQPQSFSHSTAFNDPTVPALKTEGWIMWQTIQLLLGPDEHSQFLMEAVRKWEVKDPVTGEVFPKTLPRMSFPEAPDKHMVAWYEGVSERLREEAAAEEEQRLKEIEAEKAETRRLRQKVQVEEGMDEEGSVDSRGPALAYFRNPLYRHVDGRPSIIRRGSKRPALSPRPTMMEKGKEAATTMGHIVRNIGSPHLWDGSRSGSRHTSRESRDRRRRSLPDQRHPVHHPGDPIPASTAGGAPEPVGLNPHDPRHRRRRSSHQPTTPLTGDEAEWDADESSAAPHTPLQHGHHHRRPPPNVYGYHPGSRDSTLRHSKSHEPTPSEREYGDYFEGFDDPQRRRNSTQGPGSPASPAASGLRGGFGPSASPLFATHVARHPAPPPPPMGADRPVEPHSSRSSGPGRRDERRHHRSPSDRHERERERHDDRSHHSRPRYDLSPGRYDSHSDRERDRHHPPRRSFDEPHHHDRRRLHSGRISGDDYMPYVSDIPVDGRQGRPKQTRFADASGDGEPARPPPGPPKRAVSRGVDGRRYVSAAPWEEGR